MSQPILPLAVWQSGTNNNSIPANDNSLRVEVALKEAISIADSEPVDPEQRDLHIVGTPWGGFATNNAVIYLGDTWYEYEAYAGWVKSIGGGLYYFDGSDWVEGSGGGIPDAPTDGNTYGRKDGDWDVVSAGGESPAVTLSGGTYTLGDLTPGAWHVFTSATAVTLTVEDDSVESVPANAEYGLECRGTGGITIVEDNAAAIIPPKGGTLVLETGDFTALKRTAADEYKLIGSTVAA